MSENTFEPQGGASVESLRSELQTLRERQAMGVVVTLLYSRYRSVISQVPTAKKLIPAQVEGTASAPDLGGAVYEYEPSEEAILETLLPRNIVVQLLAAVLENNAVFSASLYGAAIRLKALKIT